MMRDLESWFGELARDVDGRGLAGPADVRRAADRRARRRGAYTAGAAAFAAAAVGVGVVTVPASQPGPVDPTPTAAPTPTSSATPPATPSATPSAPPPTTPSNPPARPVTSIPARAFFALPADRRIDGLPPAPLDDDTLTGFCTDPLADDDSVTARRSQQTTHQGPDAPAGSVPRGTVKQMVMAYRPGGASAAMDRVRAESLDCAEFTVGSTTYGLEMLKPPPAYGDEVVHVAVHWQARYNPDGDPFPHTDQVLVIRVGDIVTVVRDNVWEGGQAKQADVRLFGELAVAAIERWR
ncbi:hypothetical protein [Asanoa sp. NPDC050611]|uniref:hypothetical protein n=1 Tax=Asanoa sp. NPDC050611 TaxID=3157098 RepID=UPI0034043B6C